MACVITIEGNIGSGKSTLVNNLKEKLDENLYCFVQEPVDIWQTITDSEGVDIISKFYADQTKYAFSFQMMAYISRLSILRKSVRENPGKILISERSLYTDKLVFAKMLYDQGKMEDVDYKIYNKWFEDFIEEIPQMGLIYLKTDPNIAFDRVLKRNREGENIPLEYLEDCSRYHDNWIVNDEKFSLTKMIIDGNVNITEDPEMICKWSNRIETFANSFKKRIEPKVQKIDSFGKKY